MLKEIRRIADRIWIDEESHQDSQDDRLSWVEGSVYSDQTPYEDFQDDSKDEFPNSTEVHTKPEHWFLTTDSPLTGSPLFCQHGVSPSLCHFSQCQTTLSPKAYVQNAFAIPISCSIHCGNPQDTCQNCKLVRQLEMKAHSTPFSPTEQHLANIPDPGLSYTIHRGFPQDTS